jgi:subtilisin family serine protease
MAGLERYVVLRTEPAPVRRASPARGRGAASGAVETVELTVADRHELKREPGVAVAPVMPMRLIQPVTVRTLDEENSGGIAWGVRAVGADTTPYDGTGVVVAVLDTGIDTAHDAFRGVGVVRRNFTTDADADADGHGTHCAGTIVGRDVGGFRLGVARGVDKLLVGKVLGRRGGSTDALATAIEWAVAGGAHVVSMSLGIDFTAMAAELQREGLPVELATSTALEAYRDTVRLFDALSAYVASRAATRGSGTVIVAAAGNESRRELRPDWTIGVAPPANADGVVSVAALGVDTAEALAVAAFSNTGAVVAGPGVDVVSAKSGGGLVAMSGTSMATPHVAGVAALWAQKLLAEYGVAAPETLRAHLIGRAQALPGLRASDVGSGLVRAPLT